MYKYLFILGISLFTTASSQAGSLDQGEDISEEIDCKNKIMEEMSDAVNLVCMQKGNTHCVDVNYRCKTHQREIFSGVDLKQSLSKPELVWNGQGGRGGVITDAAFCLLADLSHKKVINSRTYETGIGEMSFHQTLGLLSLEPLTQQLRAYHSLSVCAPVLGCVDASTQSFSLSVRQSPPKDSRTTGDYEIAQTYALEMSSGESHKSAQVQTPFIPVSTPIGTIQVQPRITIENHQNVVFSPYHQNSTQGQVPFFGEQAVLLNDLYGRIPGSWFESYTGGIDAGSVKSLGWNSQVGFGQRDAVQEHSIWSPTRGYLTRPDFDFSQARSDSEKAPTFSFQAKANLTYAPTHLLPKELISNDIKLTFNIAVEPELNVRFAEQFHLFFGEGQLFLSQLLSAPHPMLTGENLRLSTGMSSQLRMVLKVGMNLVAHYLNSNGSLIKLVDVHPRFELPITEKNESIPGATAFASVRSKPNEVSTFSDFLTFQGINYSTDGQKFIQSCKNSSTPYNSTPSSEYHPGEMADLFKTMVYPCNICVGTQEVHFENQGVHSVKPSQVKMIFQSEKKSDWKCDHSRKIGCMDLCTYDPSTSTMSVFQTAHELSDLGGGKGCYSSTRGN